MAQNTKRMDEHAGCDENTQKDTKSVSSKKSKVQYLQFNLLKELEELNRLDNPKPKGTKRNSSCQVVKQPYAAKKRKTDSTSVRKNLFSAPQARFKSPAAPLARKLPVREFPPKQIPKVKVTSSQSSLDDEEYLQMEQNCTESPLKNVCNMLQKTTLTQNTTNDGKKCDIEQLRSRLLRLEGTMNNLVDMVSKQCTVITTELKSIYDDLSDISKNDSTVEENKENKRRSPRIALKNLNGANAQLDVDLRVATLKKNLNKNVEFDVASPELRKISKANEMYSSMFNNYRNAGVLNTPKLIRQNSTVNSLSDAVQKQCLLLQDTPKH